MFGICCSLTAPSIPGVNVSLHTNQQTNNFQMPLTRRDMQRCTSIKINTINIYSLIHQQFLKPIHIPLTRQKQQLHRRVQIIRYSQSCILDTHTRPVIRIHRTLPSKDKPLSTPTRPRRILRVIQRRLAPEAE
ncbi:hypothetical protein ZOSMA_513G00020 [Zostera marina]|uniref:Uncharacterized protein n=1 Tax=Zostera marina TaxID=29655 RepID=A0A0K9P043_ZOSMR|nr:hypothetical protein ZOSMA_513G00020 [Zostera marina]